MGIADEELLKIVRQFRKGLIGKASSTDKCFMVCAPLQGMLAFMGVVAEMVELHFEATNHFVLRLADGRVLDPTADQFGIDGMPAIYLGEMPSIYLEWARANAEESRVENSEQSK